MAALAMVMPILPGKKDKWLKMIEEINSPAAKPDFDVVRENAGLHERTFLQETPIGDFVILTYDGDAAPWEGTRGSHCLGWKGRFLRYCAMVHKWGG